MKKKVLSVILTACMLFSLLPCFGISSLAGGTTPTVLEYQKASQRFISSGNDYYVTFDDTTYSFYFDIQLPVGQTDLVDGTTYTLADAFGSPKSDYSFGVYGSDNYLDYSSFSLVRSVDGSFSVSLTTTSGAQFELSSPAYKYEITKAECENGSYDIDTDTYVKKDTVVTITTEPDENYALDEIKVYKTGEATTVVEVSEDNKFTMPEYAVTIEVTFVAAEHNITVDDDTIYGTVEVEGETALYKDEVTVTVNPDEGYKLGKITVYKTDEPATTVSVSDNKFTMPNYDVTVTATFKKTNETVFKDYKNKKISDLDDYSEYGGVVTRAKARIDEIEYDEELEMCDNKAKVDKFYDFVIEYDDIVKDGNDFTDVPGDAWYLNSVNYVTNKEIAFGVSETEYKPDAIGNRAMFVTMLYNMAGSPEWDFNDVFEDVKSTDWYAIAVSWAYDNGITNGVAYGYFAPDNTISRQEMAVMLMAYADLMGMDTSARASLDDYTDALSVEYWAEDAMQWCVATEIITGVGEDTLAPAQFATRAEMTQVIANYLTSFLQPAELID